MSSSETPSGENRMSIDHLRKEIETLREKMRQIEKERVEYLQNVSHQIVAPLNAMKWHIENITEVRVSVDRAKKVLRSIYSQATLAVHLAKNFSLMSNLEGDHTLASLQEPLQEVDLHRLLVNLADDFQPLGWDQEIKIVVDDAHFPARPPVLVIKPLISQVFSNILENAVKYSSSGSTIFVWGEHDPKAGTYTVQIRNQGIPLRTEDEGRVFDRTFRTEQAKRKYPAGTGFGLYIAKRIVAIHEGSIRAATEGTWTVFSVTLSVEGLKGKARFRAQQNHPSSR
jgi:signal transduction histidine kinase